MLPELIPPHGLPFEALGQHYNIANCVLRLKVASLEAIFFCVNSCNGNNIVFLKAVMDESG